MVKSELMVPMIVGIDREQFDESVIPLGCEDEKLDPTRFVAKLPGAYR